MGVQELFEIIYRNTDLFLLLQILTTFSLSIRLERSSVFSQLNISKFEIMFWTMVQTGMSLTTLIYYKFINHDHGVLGNIFLVASIVTIILYQLILVFRVYKYKSGKKNNRLVDIMVAVQLYLGLMFVPWVIHYAGLFEIRYSLIIMAIGQGIFFLLWLIKVKDVLFENKIWKIIVLSLMASVMTVFYVIPNVFDYYNYDNISHYVGMGDFSLLPFSFLAFLQIVLIGLVMNRRLFRFEATQIYYAGINTVVKLFMGIFFLMATIYFIVLEYSDIYIKEQTYARMREHVAIIESVLDRGQLKSLSGREEDMNTHEYLEIEGHLSSYINATNNLVYIYIYQKLDDQNFMNLLEVQSDAESGEAFVPGEIYSEASEDMNLALVSSEIIFEGPDIDEYGNWISAYIGIQLSDDKQVLLGIDIDADLWYIEILEFRNQIFTGLFFVTLIAIIAFDGVLAIVKLSAQNKQAQERYKQLYDVASDGIVILRNGFIEEVNSKAQKLFGMPKSKLIDKDIIKFSPAEQEDGQSTFEKFSNLVARLKTEKEIEFEWVVGNQLNKTYLEGSMREFNATIGKRIQIIFRDVSDKKMTENEQLAHISQMERLNKLMIGRELKMIDLKKQIAETQGGAK